MFVLALDGLEYGFVRRWNLRHLMQETCGSFEVGPEYFAQTKVLWGLKRESVPYTPKVWVSFLTGRKPKEHGVEELFTYRSRVVEFVRWLPPLCWVRGKRKLLAKVGLRTDRVLKGRFVNRSCYRQETMFDIVKPSVAVWFMGYNMPSELWEHLREASERGVSEIPKAVWRVHMLRRRRVFSLLRSGREWRLFGAYFELADWLGHLFYIKSPRRLRRAYEELDQLAWELQCAVPQDTVFLVVSDHGMEASEDGVTGNHSTRAFWSLSVETDWRPRDFTDFFPKVVEWAGIPP